MKKWKKRWVLSIMITSGGALAASAALVVETQGFESGGEVTHAVAASFTVSVGDVIAVVGAGNNDVLPNDSAALSAAGIEFTYLHKSSGGGPRATSWYGTVQTNGTIDVLYTTATAGNLSLGLYHLSCATGNVIQLLDTADEGTASATSLSAAYDFGSAIPEVILLEAAASYEAFQNLPALDANKGNADKFIARHETFTNVSGATSAYNLLEAKAIAIAGLAFAEFEYVAPLPLAGPENSAFRYVGRFTDDYRFGWSGSMIETDFSGSKIQADLEMVADSEAGLIVVVDGVPRFLHVSSSTATYTLAENLEVGIAHRIQIFKRSEGALGTLKFNGFRVADDGTLSRPDAPTRKMLVIGDSITCGFGNEGLDVADGNTVENENGYMSYAPIAARTFGADIMMFSWSGRGMYRNGTGDALVNTIPLIFNQTLPEDAGPQWDHSRYVPDVIVINLGTNDRRDTDRAPLTDFETEFKQEYTNFIGRLRDYYPDSEIVLCIGSMGMDPVDGWLPEIAAEFTDTTWFTFTPMTVKDRGGSYHPNVPKDISMAAELVNVITAATDWTPKARHLVNFQFSETAGTDWINAVNRGSDTAIWNSANPDALTDGTWHTHITATADAYRNYVFSTPVTQGVVTVEYRINSWNLTNSVAGSGVQFGVNGWTAKLMFDNNDATKTRVRGVVNLNSGSVSANGYMDGQSSSDGVTLRQVVDLDAADGPTMSLSYKPGGTDGFVTLITDQAYIGATSGVSSIGFFNEGTTPWTGGDYIDLDSLTVSVTPSVPSPATLWNDWLAEFPTLGANTNLLDNTDGDDWINLVEYALGGNPSVPDSAAIFQVLETGETHYIEYVYPRRTDAASRGLSYQLLHTTNLLQAVWISNRFEFERSGAIDTDFDSVTNRISTEAEDQLFIKLQVEQSQGKT